jgi:hypothetical protein
MRAIGFCVSIGHAEFMAEWFERAGVPSLALTSQTDGPARRAAIERLQRGELRAIFAVDLFNEGVDVPAVDTILLLRPTESATIFLQQLGRGLRLFDDKPCLTVLDFIGAQHAHFRFDLRYRALTGTSRRGLEQEIERDFPTLPAGCHIQLDRVAKQTVLTNVRRALHLRRADMAGELRRLGNVRLNDFLADTGLDIEDLYRTRAHGGWTGLRREAGFETATGGPDDLTLGAAIGRMLHIDDSERLDRLQKIANGEQSEGRLGAMLHVALWGTAKVSLEDGLRRLLGHPQRCEELRQVAEVLSMRIHRVTPSIDMAFPVRLHARYSRNEACVAFGISPETVRAQGVKWVPEANADVFFVTLNKTERHYSPTTMYQDRAITPELFQWESQSTTSTRSPTGQRYIHHAERGSTVHLFVRETKDADGDLGVPPYLYAGPMTYTQHTGDRPMRIVWRLKHPLPADIFHAARVAGG